MRKHAVNLICLGMASLVGCTTPAVTRYPEFTGVTTIAASSDTVSTWTETPAQDYLIPNSHVFISGRGPTGVLGLVGVAIDRSRNAAAVGNAASALALKFHNELTAALRRHISHPPYNGKYQVLQPDASATIKALPYARFLVQPDQTAQLTFQLVVRFAGSAQEAAGRRTYFYSLAGSHPFTASADAWSDKNSIRFREAAQRALDRLALVFLQDLSGKFAPLLEPQRQRLIRWRPLESNEIVTSVLLQENPEYFVVVPMARNQPLRSFVSVVERALVRVETR